MTNSRILPPLLILILGLFFNSPSLVLGDDTNGASLADVHHILLQTTGQSDTPLTPDQQIELLHKAFQMLKAMPGYHHSQLRRATRDISSALDELAKGDPSNQARVLILAADAQIKSVQ